MARLPLKSGGKEATNEGFGRKEARNEGAGREESRLLERAQKGERAALGLLYQRYQGRVYGLALRLCGHRHDAEDVLQEVFLRVYRGIERFEGRAGLMTWLYRLTVNTTRSLLQKQKRQSEKQEECLQRWSGLEKEEPPVALSRDPVARRRLEEALGRLPEKYREVLVLHDVEGLAHQEIAEILGIRRGTSKSQLHKARLRMRSFLREVER